MELFQFDADYLDRLKRADPSTERHFCGYFGRMLTIKLRSRLRSSQAVEDLQQETLFRVLKAVRAGNTIENAGKLGSFVNSVCNFVLLEHFRAGKRDQPFDEHTIEPSDETIDLEGAFSTSETRAQVRRILDSLERKDRDLLRAVFFEERDKDQICQEYGVDRSYLRVLLYRAKTQFRVRYKAVAG